MSYWWQSPINRALMIGRPILKVTGEGCQACNSFEWLGRVVDIRKVEGKDHSEIVIRILIHNNSYTDARDQKEPELFTYPLVNADIQNVKGAWVLFT